MTMPIRCPICGARLMDANDESILSQTVIEPVKKGNTYDYIVKCTRCKSKIGVSKLAEKSIA